MSWALLGVAAIFEIAFAISIKPTEGFTRLAPTVAVVVFGAISVYLLSKTLNRLPVGTAYAAWTGLGAVGTVALGIVIYHEPVTALRIGCIALIVVGVTGLRLAASS